jgi:8-oxo-dGTP pyrophosphatase MutT (NUDIX family)
MARTRGPAEARNDGPPATPRPAASTVLVRRGGKHRDDRLEVLLLKRTDKAAFMPNAWVFPGGSVDPIDGEGPEGYRACARRELLEEAGVTLPDDEEMVPFCRWITPEIVSRRFDAWFFLAVAPAHTKPTCDGVETVDARWFEPSAALAAHDAGEVVLAFPTRTQLTWLAVHPTAEAALAAYRDATLDEPIIPELVGDGDERRLILPGLADSVALRDIPDVEDTDERR